MKTKKIFLIAFCLCLFSVAQAQLSKETEFTNKLFDFLSQENHKPDRKGNDLSFSYNDNDYTLKIKWDDPLFFIKIDLLGDVKLGNGLDRDIAIEASNEVNREIRAVKLSCTEDYVFFRIEQYTKDFEYFKNVFRTNIYTFAYARERFMEIYDKMYWRKLIRSAMNNPTKSIDNRKYKGQMSNENPNGLGTMYWSESKDFHIGSYNNQIRSGNGIVIIGDFYDDRVINNCSDCKIYVGNFSNGVKSGRGTCYDKEGKLVYHGNFVDDKPTGEYPLKDKDDYEQYKFEITKYDNGDYYVGETFNGKRHGAGIYLWQNSNMWYGDWKDGIRDGYGIFIPKNGKEETAILKDNESKLATTGSVSNNAKQRMPSITIVNDTGYTINSLYISPQKVENWGSDRLASNETITKGNSVTIRLQDALSVVNLYKIRLVDSDGDTYLQTNVQVSNGSRIEFTIKHIEGYIVK